MKSFLAKCGAAVLGVLNGFDRLCFRGTLRNLAYPQGLQHYLWAKRIPFKDFDRHSKQVTQQVVEASLRHAQETGCEIRYLNSADYRKEDVARDIAARDGISAGLICVLRSVDPCMSFAIHKSHVSKRLEIEYRQRKCLYLYHYQIHPVFGFMHARIQTWFPFRIYVCLNGREWLARQLDQAGLSYQRRDNGFTWIEDLVQAQRLLDTQLRTNWPRQLNAIAQSLNPLHDRLFAEYPTQYYWSVDQNEWASDILFRRRADLEALYPRLVRHAMATFSSADVLRFLGRKLTANGEIPARFAGEVMSSRKTREEGVRVKHWLNYNSIKIYDKGSALRVETTINNPLDFRVYRAKESDPQGEKAWRTLRHGVADLHRRAQVSQAANERYVEALAAVTASTALKQLAEPLCRPVVCPGRPKQGAEGRTRAYRVRALNPLAADDAALLQAISQPEFVINGLRNRDLCRLLYPSPPASPAEQRRRSAAVTRKLRLLRGHGLIHKVPKTHRYQVSSDGRKAIIALLAARDASADELTANAA
jgi:hypothetical protein